MADKKNNANRSNEAVIKNSQEQSVKANKNSPKTSKFKDTVWHYTTLESAIKILEGMNMRASYYTTMNDRLDVQYGFRIAKEILDNYSMNIELKEALECIFNAIFNAKNPKYPYILCFSNAMDSIAQWQGYTHHIEGGCALGFNRKTLKSFFSSSKFVPKEFNCLYNKDEIQTKLKKIINEEIIPSKIYNSISKVIYGTVTKEDINIEVDNVLKRISEIALRAKHEGFEHEHEYRLVFTADDEHEWVSDPPYDKRYITCSFYKSMLNTITHIQLSPHGKTEYNRICLENFLSKHLDYKIDIIESDVPYRGRFK